VFVDEFCKFQDGALNAATVFHLYGRLAGNSTAADADRGRRGIGRWRGGSLIWDGMRIISGILLMLGLWTPIAGALVVIAQMWNIFDKAGDLWAQLLLAIMGASLALLGPGFWSVDARLFGWKRIYFRDR
jgi:hypothetical protein